MLMGNLLYTYGVLRYTMAADNSERPTLGPMFPGIDHPTVIPAEPEEDPDSE